MSRHSLLPLQLLKHADVRVARESACKRFNVMWVGKYKLEHSMVDFTLSISGSYSFKPFVSCVT